MSDDSESIRVQLEGIRGDIKLVLAGQDRANSDILDLRHTTQGHDSRINALEAKNDHNTGERKGLLAGGRLLWATVGLIPGGAVAALAMRAFQ